MKIFFVCFTIWVLTAMLNSIVTSCCMFVLLHADSNLLEASFIVFIATLIFSLPGIFILWLTLLFCHEKENLFGVLLRSGFIICAISCCLFCLIPAIEMKERFVLAVCVLISFITSIMFHHRIIRSFITDKKTNGHA